MCSAAGPLVSNDLKGSKMNKTDSTHRDDGERSGWRAKSACGPGRGVPTWLFFSDNPADEAAAVKVCAGCPVSADCLEWAIRTGSTYGVFGGTTEAQRRRRRVPGTTIALRLLATDDLPKRVRNGDLKAKGVGNNPSLVAIRHLQRPREEGEVAHGGWWSRDDLQDWAEGMLADWAAAMVDGPAPKGQAEAQQRLFEMDAA